MTLTAWCRMRSLVWGLSWLRCSWHILPSSLNASLMSRTLRRSRALLATRRSLSRSIFTSGGRSSSSSLSWLVTNRDKEIKLCAGRNSKQTINWCVHATSDYHFSSFKFNINSRTELCTDVCAKNEVCEQLLYYIKVNTGKTLSMKRHLRLQMTNLIKMFTPQKLDRFTFTSTLLCLRIAAIGTSLASNHEWEEGKAW